MATTKTTKTMETTEPTKTMELMPFVYCGFAGVQPFQKGLGCSDERLEDCNWCHGEDAMFQMSIRRSANIWPAPKDDPFMYIGYDCWQRSVRQNPHLDILDKLVKYITKDIAVGILEYFGDDHGERYMTQVLNRRD